jgi:lambda repressor-like predicted transcriptional regulator
MSSSEQRLQEEIEELRADVGETVEALVHKVDVPAQVKERGTAMKDQAIERGVELQQQAVQRGSELSGWAIEWCSGAKAQVVERGNELLRQSVDAAGRARESLSQTPTDRWAKLTGAGLALLALVIIVRKMRTR